MKLRRALITEDEGAWIDEDDLKKLKAQWQYEKWQKISMINKQNRKSKVGHNEIVGGINKKGSIFRLGSQAATIKEFLKSSSFISIDVSSDKVVAIEVKIEALTAELEKKNLEQEMIKQKIEHWERMFGSFMPNPNQNFPLQPEGEVDNENVEMSDGKL
ncbi:unnamed protein product [Vicia faba]|uniref:Uncharacterized protein n=1 Tax=Vicia faba TaxID=3906 RepID=A0AAV0YDT3_VICFA|nr:unnamed protein product [Vicia faba]